MLVVVLLLLLSQVLLSPLAEQDALRDCFAALSLRVFQSQVDIGRKVLEDVVVRRRLGDSPLLFMKPLTCSLEASLARCFLYVMTNRG